ncbi:MAG: TRAP transporter large permease [Candidatus Rokubacteria bacterium]|nr:TRAP transporter large permease [Candidatus Rokubacteria bacterium]
MTVAIPIGLLMVLFIVGMPIGIALGVAGLLGLYLAGGADVALGLLALNPYRESASFILSAVPMFVLMAEFSTRGGLARDLYHAAYKWTGHWPGGLGMAAIFSSAAMGAMSGASTASAAAIAGASMDEMTRYGYDRSFAAGTIAMGGTLAIMIPPSIPMVIYGVQTETSIGQLFIAGVIPGILTALLYAAVVWGWVRFVPRIAPRVLPFSRHEHLESLKPVWTIVVLVTLIIGGMYAGFFTPTEAGAVGAAGALVITIAMGRLGLREILPALYNTAMTTTMIMTIVIGAHFFSFFLTIAGVTQTVSSILTSVPLSPVATLVLIILPIYLVLGMFMDNVPILLLTLPVVFPAVTAMGFDPIWFGVIVIAMGEVGLVTPPVGLTVFVVSSVAKVPLDEVFRGALPFLLAEAAAIALLILVPGLATFLPNLMR